MLIGSTLLTDLRPGTIDKLNRPNALPPTKRNPAVSERQTPSAAPARADNAPSFAIAVVPLRSDSQDTIMVQEPPTPSPTPAEELPIDIDHAKFLSWLIDRRRVPRDWHTYLKTARSLSRHAISQTPASALEALSLPTSATAVPYYTAVDALTALTSSTAPESWAGGPDKDLLGRYKGRTARAWAAAVAAFERKDVYLADSAQLLVRNADVEARAIKARITRLQADAAEYARRDAPAVRSAKEARERFEDACKEFELPTEEECDFQTLLAMAVEKRVPQLLAEAVACAKEQAFVGAVKYYEDFAHYVKEEGADTGDELCSTAKRVMQGEVNLLTLPVKPVQEAVADDRVDWGISAVDLDASGDGAETSEIDWGIEIDTSASGEAAAVGDDGGGSSVHAVGIDWNDAGEGIAEPEADAGADADVEIAVESEEVFTLADPRSRELYLNDLIELDAFLAQRAAELSQSGNSEIALVMQQSSSTPEFVSSVDVERVRVLQQNVRSAIGVINSADTRRMLALQSDSKRVERAARAVLEKKHVAERMHAAIDVLRKRRVKAVEELAVENPKFEDLAKITRDVKRRTEIALSKLYKGRTVNILGEINNVFPPMD